MPRTSVICEVSGQYVSDDDCLNCARHRLLQTDPAGNQRHCQFPYSYIKAFIESTKPRQHAGISSTMIAAECVRKAVWEPQKPYGLFPHEAQAAMSGTARHEFYEHFNEDGILAEVRLAIRMPSGRVITGQIDRYLPAHHRIEDYKFKTEEHVPFNKAPLNYVAQQNIYRYMLMTGCVVHETGEKIPPQEEITDLVLFASNHKDWLEVRCPIWPVERVEWYIETMLDFFEASKDPNYLLPRVYAEPQKTRFCQTYCHW